MWQDRRIYILFSREKCKRRTYKIIGAKEYSLSLPPADDSQEINVVFLDTNHPGTGLSIDKDSRVNWGDAVHTLLKIVMENPGIDLVKKTKTVFRCIPLDEKYMEGAINVINSVQKSALWQRALKSDQCYTEIPFQLLLDDEPALPTMLRGSIDLIFKENEKWILVDYKTDTVNKKNVNTLIKKYTPQLKTYREAWEKCTQLKVDEMILFFI